MRFCSSFSAFPNNIGISKGKKSILCIVSDISVAHYCLQECRVQQWKVNKALEHGTVISKESC